MLSHLDSHITTTDPPSSSQPPFSDDVCHQILKYLHWREIIQTCTLLSTQFHNVISEHHLSICIPRRKLTRHELHQIGSSCSLSKTTQLDISGNSINDEGILDLSHMKGLRVLNVAFNPIEKAQVVFEMFGGLREVDMRGIKVSRECVETIVKCESLRLEVFAFQSCDDGADKLMACRAMQHVTDLYTGALSHTAVTALCEHLRLKKLKIYGIDNQMMKTIASCENMSQLETLVLLKNTLQHEGILAIAQSEHLRKVTELNISGCSPTLESLQELMSSDNVKLLKILQINNTQLGNDGFKAIVNSSNLGQLTGLEVHSCLIRQEGVKALSESPFMSQLTQLRISANNIRDGVKYLSESLHVTKLHSLQLFGYPIGWEGMIQLFSSENFQHLTDLSLTAITNDGVCTLVQSQTLTKLRKLHLCKGLMDSNACEMLASCENLRNLTFLELGSNPLGNEGVHHIVNSPFITQLVDLDLFSVSMDDEGVKSITQSDNLSQLEKLFLGQNGVTDVGAELLANAQNLKHLKGLHMGWNRMVSQKGRDMLFESAILKRCNVKFQN